MFDEKNRFSGIKTAILALSIVACVGVLGAEEVERKYVGTDKCKPCHRDQYTAWKNKKHSKAWDALKPEERKRQECVKCHSTDGTADLPNVGCEACHGPGSAYKNPKIMNKAKWAADPDGQLKLAEAAGLMRRPGETICARCHSEESPDFKGFDFEKAKQEIKHWK